MIWNYVCLSPPVGLVSLNRVGFDINGILSDTAAYLWGNAPYSRVARKVSFPKYSLFFIQVNSTHDLQ